MAPTIITIPNVTLAAIAEIAAFWRHPELALHWLPEDLPALVVVVFLLNYAFWFAWVAFIYPFCFDPLRHFPAPKVVVISRLLSRARQRLPPGQLMLQLAEKTPNDGIVVVQGMETSLVLTKPAALADVLVHHPYDFAKFDYIRDFLRPVLGDGLVVVEGDRHKLLRKNAQPAFKFSHIKKLCPVMWKKGVAFCDAIAAELDRQETATIEMNAWASKAALDVIGIAALGRDFNVLTNPNDPLIKNYHELLRPGKAKFLYFLMSVTFSRGFVKWLPWETARAFEKTTTNIKAICGQLVRDPIDAIAKGDDDHFDILSLLIKSDNFSERELSSLRAEISTALPHFHHSPHGLPPSPDDLSSTLEHLPLLNATLNETLRLYPTVPVTVRVATRHTTLCGYPIRKGTELIIPPWLVNRYTALWGPDSTVFSLDKWIGEDGKPNTTGGVESNFANMTFLHGPRGCIGQGFAKAELRCLLAAFVMRFRWSLGMKEEDVVPGGVVSIRPVNGLHLEIRKVGGAGGGTSSEWQDERSIKW
ncbi:cytochrome P450 [Podospora aff. communis PSN243]|uniref:Cytochrome P450 n=1 Tax=Podospora aff. communis PSN243 TaxID=3040156 RepID=A0AAV9GPB4_9PEZI|nr:cytochrome P450 [Podospora aff. communis PSN243]